MDCPYRDTKCYFANDRRHWDMSFNGQPVELGTIECTLPTGIECPQDIDPSDESDDWMDEEADSTWHGPDINKPYKDFWG